MQGNEENNSSFFAFHFSYAQHYVLYGLTSGGGTNNDGTIFTYDPQSGKENVVLDFSGSSGVYNSSGLIQASDGMLYGMTWQGGIYDYGTLFRFNPYNHRDTVLINFNSANGAGWEGSCNLIQAKNGLLYGTTGGGGLFNRAGVLFSYNVQTFKDSVLFRFDTIPGFLPCNNPSEDTSTGLLYGMTEFGGSYIGSGVLYCYNPKTGKDSVLINFDTTKGFGPVGSYLFLASNGMFYGMTQYGGDSGKGVVFRYNPKTGQDTILINFNGLNGEVPQCNSLMQATNGLLYGIVAFGGSNNSGVLFSLDPVTNNYTVLVNLNGTSEGTQAYGVLVEQPGTNLLYGMTVRGGTYNMGVLFCYNIATNKDSVLFNFNGTNGSYPFSFPIFIKDTLNGINELTVATNKVIIYPNPNGGKFTVKVMSAELRTKSVLKIYNMLGEQVHQSTLKTSSTQVNLSNEAKGIYLYRIISESGEPISQGKFIIQ